MTHRMFWSAALMTTLLAPAPAAAQMRVDPLDADPLDWQSRAREETLRNLDPGRTAPIREALGADAELADLIARTKASRRPGPGARPAERPFIEFDAIGPDEAGRAGEDLPVPPARLRRSISAASLDFNLYGNLADESARRDYLRVLLGRWIEQAAAIYDLSPAQAEKLRLMGRGDIERFFRRVAEARAEFETARLDPAKGEELLRAVVPLRRQFELGPFGDGSLFAGALVKMLADRKADHPASPDRSCLCGVPSRPAPEHRRCPPRSPC